MSKKNVEDAFGEEIPFERPTLEEEFTEEELKLLELGLPPETVKMLSVSWEGRYGKKKKIFHPNHNSFETLTKGFWEHAMDRMSGVDILKINLDLLPEELADMTRKQIENKSDTDDLYRQIAILQKERDTLQEKLRKMENSIEVMDYNQSEHELLLKLIDIFIDQDIKTDVLSKSQIELIKEVMK